VTGIFLLALLFAFSLSACAPEPVATPTPPPQAHSVASSPSSAPPAVKLPPGPDPAVASAIGIIDRAMFTRDIKTLAAGPRHHSAAPEHLLASADYIARELTAAGYTVTRQPVRHAGAEAPNVIAERNGEDTSRVILVSAHYDSVAHSPGADDNASGVAAMLGIARAVAKHPGKASLRMVAFAFEESGLVGSGEYTAMLGPIERARIAAVVNLEMIGYKTARLQDYPKGLTLLPESDDFPRNGDFIGILGLSDQPDTTETLLAARPYAPNLKVASVTVPRALVLFTPDLLRSDHAHFWKFGIPAVIVTDTAEFRNHNYHQSSDSIETLDLDFAAEVTRWLAAGVILLGQLQPTKDDVPAEP
jgi:hypothetical protein